MSSTQPIYANTPKGRVVAGHLTSDGVYLQRATPAHYMRTLTSKGMDVSIYEYLQRQGCRYWKVLDNPPLLMPFAKIALLLRIGVAEKIKNKGYDTQIQIPLSHFNCDKIESDLFAKQSQML